MVNRELQRRLEQIRQSEVPYRIVSGCNLPKFIKLEDVVGYFGEERVPEIVDGGIGSPLFSRGDPVHSAWPRSFFCSLNPDRSIRGNNLKKYAEIFARALGNPKKTEYFMNGTGVNLERHVIYDPQTNLTYEFILPSRKVLKLTSKNPD